jgi:hypothetical protein
MGWNIWIEPLAGPRDFFLLQNFQISCGAQPHSCSISISGSFSGVKRPGWDADHLHVVSGLIMSGARTSLHQYAFTHGQGPLLFMLLYTLQHEKITANIQVKTATETNYTCRVFHISKLPRQQHVVPLWNCQFSVEVFMFFTKWPSKNLYRVVERSTNFSKIQQPCQSSTCQVGYMRQVPH